MKEALEANDWEGTDGLGEVDLDTFGDEEDGEGGFGFSIEAAEMEMEMFGMKQAVHEGGERHDEGDEGADQEDEVEKLQAMMLKMQAVRGKSQILGLKLAN